MKFRNLCVLFVFILGVTIFVFCTAEDQEEVKKQHLGWKAVERQSIIFHKLAERIKSDQEAIYHNFMKEDWAAMMKKYSCFEKKGETVIITTPEGREIRGAERITGYWKSLREGAVDLIIETVSLNYNLLISQTKKIDEDAFDAVIIEVTKFRVIKEKSNASVNQTHLRRHIMKCDI